ncbi:FAD-binding domain-containing protein [Peniophora sp. CONT]|nr:FAD-binding domain-containing protein [Peniophora sp. CONT]
MLPTISVVLFVLAAIGSTAARCRSEPGQLGFPSTQDWTALNETVDGRLVAVVPSAKACADIGCTAAQWSSSTFRNALPGQMNAVSSWQNYTSDPAELCLHNSTGSCSQGDVPLYAINATSPEHLQAGVSFASQHDLRVSVKSSGHDYLGRSTARNSLLLWTQYFQDIEFTESFTVGDEDKGSAVTVGSGVGLHTLYLAAKAVNKMVVGGAAATVSAGGGYTQGAGHSAFGPIYGLAADNTLQYEVVLANGSFVTVNEVSNPDLFWALRGGGAGSWAVIVSITMRTYPTFPATAHVAYISFNSTDQAAAAMTIHARHIFDWDDLRAGQYFYLYNIGRGRSFLRMNTLFANVSGDDAKAAIAPFIADVQTVGATFINETVTTAIANDIVGAADDNAGINVILGSRLVPATQYEHNPEVIGAAYKTLLDQDVDAYVLLSFCTLRRLLIQVIRSILGLLVAGGKVAENANINSAILPKWRTAKTHVITVKTWNDSTSPSDAVAIQERFTSQSVSVLAAATGEDDSGSYSNEADVREPDFQTTFFGPNYHRLSSIKAQYDPKDLFIVCAGVGSERWDSAGMCSV